MISLWQLPEAQQYEDFNFLLASLYFIELDFKVGTELD